MKLGLKIDLYSAVWTKCWLRNLSVFLYKLNYMHNYKNIYIIICQCYYALKLTYILCAKTQTSWTESVQIHFYFIAAFFCDAWSV